VEHPVTEGITGLDLVELMIRVAAGERLPLAQADLKREGWAIECRINAEDPVRNFLPSTGRLVRYEPPPEGAGVRVDTGVFEGGEIPMHYDSMIAKLIVHGRDRADAIARMRDALDAFVIRGIHSNIAFQSALLAHPAFQRGDFNTGFIAEHFPQGFQPAALAHDDPLFAVALAAVLNVRLQRRDAALTGQLPGHGYKVNGDLVVVLSDGGSHAVQVAESGLAATVDGREYAIDTAWTPGQVRVSGACNGAPFHAQVDRRGQRLALTHRGRRIEALVLSKQAAALQALMPVKLPPDTSRLLLSPMPGLLREVAVKPGQSVLAGDKLAVVEAMKMENILTATRDGTVAEVMAAAGESLAVDQPIVRFD
jgi:propionyl-CoA carboxylase alpha chain